MSALGYFKKVKSACCLVAFLFIPLLSLSLFCSDHWRQLSLQYTLLAFLPGLLMLCCRITKRQKIDSFGLPGSNTLKLGK